MLEKLSVLGTLLKVLGVSRHPNSLPCLITGKTLLYLMKPLECDNFVEIIVLKRIGDSSNYLSCKYSINFHKIIPKG